MMPRSLSVFSFLMLVLMAILSTTTAMERTPKLYKVIRNGPGCDAASRQTLVCHVPKEGEVNKSAVKEKLFSNVLTDGAGQKVLSVTMSKVVVDGQGMERQQ